MDGVCSTKRKKTYNIGQNASEETNLENYSHMEEYKHSYS
jgi:hypothetical protein